MPGRSNEVVRVSEKSARLVVPAVRDLRELLLVLATVVGAEKQLAAGDDDADVRLCAARIASIERGELVRGLEFIDRTGGLGVLGHGSSSVAQARCSVPQ
jgi:hypothetical protein